MEFDLWFIGFVGIDERITVVELPKKFTHEAWEVLDECISDESRPDFGIESSEIGFYKFILGVESGYDIPHEDEWSFVFEDCQRLKDYKINAR